MTGSAGDPAAAGAHHAVASSSSASSSTSTLAAESDHSLIDELDLTGLLEGLALGKAGGDLRTRQGATSLDPSRHRLPAAVRYLLGSYRAPP